MEATIVVLRPKHETKANDMFSSIDILCDGGELMSTSMLLDVEPSQVLCNYLYNNTGGDSGGLKGDENKDIFIFNIKLNININFCF